MEKVGIFYSSGTVKTAQVAKKIHDAFGKTVQVDLIDIESTWTEKFSDYNNIIVGTSTWFDGELPNYWDTMIPAIEDLSLKGKKVAIFGLGDQVAYPDNFADGIGLMADVLEARGVTLCGFTSPEGYTFSKSKALRDDKFLGLVIDFENQSDKTAKRVIDWVNGLTKDFSKKA